LKSRIKGSQISKKSSVDRCLCNSVLYVTLPHPTRFTQKTETKIWPQSPRLPVSSKVHHLLFPAKCTISCFQQSAPPPVSSKVHHLLFPAKCTTSCFQQSAPPKYSIEASSPLASDAVFVVSYRRLEEHYCFILRGQELQKQYSWAPWH
jgi:hypothetical protein